MTVVVAHSRHPSATPSVENLVVESKTARERDAGNDVVYEVGMRAQVTA